MLYLYDHAFEQKLKKVFPRVVYAPIDKFYDRYLLGANNTDSIDLPAISLWRVGHEFNPYNARSHMNTPSIQRRKIPDTELQQIYSMQIPLDYQLDIWAKSDIDRDDLFTELMYFLTLYPNISIEYEGQHLAFPLHIEPADDITDISEFESTGDLYRISVPIRVPDARLFFYKNVKYNKHIQVSLEVGENDYKEEINIEKK